MAVITYKLLPKQKLFVNSTKKQVFFSGGFGSSKSYGLCLALLKQATIPGNQILLLRKTLTSLKKSTLITLIGGTEPILPPESYQENKSDGIIKLNGGGTIYALGLDDPQRIRSMNLGAAYIDEVTELSKSEYMEVLYRLRHDIGCRQLFCCGNPAGRNHWLYKHFFEEKDINREVITSSSLENPYLPKDYVEELTKMEGNMYKRYVEGLWVSLENVIFDTFDRDKHVKEVGLNEACEEYYLGIDFGYTAPTAMVLVGKQGDRLTVIDEFYQKKVLLREIVEKVLTYNNKYNPTVIYDPSAASLGGELENAGLKPIKANNDVAGGIHRIRNKLKVRNDSPDLIISDRCTNLIREIENYQYQKDTEKPLKVFDHCLDALRYVVSNVDDNYNQYSRPVIISDDYEEDDWEPFV